MWSGSTPSLALTGEERLSPATIYTIGWSAGLARDQGVER